MRGKLFVVTVASEKGGVGKTTIATNLAVYLKALHEDLPVTIASFDNHFSVDNMFAIQRSGSGSVAALLNSKSLENSLRLGEYGVQYFPSERALPNLRGRVELLAEKLASSELEGILILDTRPILDDYTASALLAADLVLVPVKDRASLINAEPLRLTRAEHSLPEDAFWLVPSLIDGRLRLRGEIGMDEYLRFNAVERNFQVFDGHISKSPKVESLASGFSSRIPAVLTHARGTQVHKQFRQLAEFVLQQLAQTSSPLTARGRAGELLCRASSGMLRRLQLECPVCGALHDGAAGEHYLHLRSRRRGFIHPQCLEQLLCGCELQSLRPDDGLLLIEVSGQGLGGATGCRLTLFDADGNEEISELLHSSGLGRFETFLEAATGVPVAELVQETLLLTLSGTAPASFLSGDGLLRFRQLRRTALRTRFETDVL